MKKGGRETKRTVTSIDIKEYDRILVFNNQKDFEEAVKNHDYIIPLMGEKPSDKEQFPQVFIAGWK